METSTSEKNCQFCAEKILVEATVCKFCHRNQIDDKKTEEMIKSLSENKKKYYLFFFIFLIASIENWWWLYIAGFILLIFGINSTQDQLKKVSKLELIEKHEKYLKSKLINDIIFYIVVP
jgi:hypothetical protein